jgi:hypothetical protein
MAIQPICVGAKSSGAAYGRRRHQLLRRWQPLTDVESPLGWRFVNGREGQRPTSLAYAVRAWEPCLFSMASCLLPGFAIADIPRFDSSGPVRRVPGATPTRHTSTIKATQRFVLSWFIPSSANPWRDGGPTPTGNRR